MSPLGECICPFHPSLPGVPSDNRVDVAECPKHHPETVVAEKIYVSATGTVYVDFTTKAKHFLSEEQRLGLTSERLADLIEENPDLWLDTDSVDWSIKVSVDDQQHIRREIDA